MKLRCLVIALALLAAFASDSWGESKRTPAKGDQQQTQAQKQKITTDQRGTDQLPLVVQPLPTKKNAEIAEQEKREAKEKNNSDWWTWLLGSLTIVALFGQLAVFIAQAYFLKGTLTATANTANAANLNAQGVIDAERAHLFVVVVRHDVSETIQAGNQGRHDPSIEKTKMQGPVLAYVFRNAGKTPAILEEVMHSMMLEKTEQHTITYEAPDRALEIIPGESDLIDRIAVTFDERPFLVEDAMALGDHDLMLFFYSAATYRDIYNRKHKIRHDFLYSAGRFHLINRIEKTIEPQEQGGAETEQTSRTGFFSRPPN
jgi:hypothetical protein